MTSFWGAPVPIETVIDPARKVVFTTCNGTMTIAEIAEACIQMARDPAFDPGFSHLNDLSGVTDIHVSIQELNHFVAARLDPFSETSRRVFVAGEPFVFGMARMYENLVNLPGFVVVRTLEEGREYLGLEPGTAARP